MNLELADNSVPDDAATIGRNLDQVKQQIAAAVTAARRDQDTVSLVAVSKIKPASAISAAIAAGQLIFGENKVQEAMDKWPALKAAHPHVRLHLIGPLQSNKARKAIELFDVIETVDRPKLARHLARIMTESGLVRPVFVQINTGEEAQKAGIPPNQADDFITLCRDQLGLRVEGLMCIPPAEEEPAMHFALLQKIAKRNGLAGLSMGMSADFETAIAFGASHVRVGTAIFGARPPQQS